ncbi:MAG TPA: nucleotidyltransferase family protein [Nocardioidaceae bacterium]|nr:nucleotidyltransferase family protein [Nocardioidaceae bacterium]
MGARVAGLVLAAGEGRRMGVPKALLRDVAGTPWVVGAVQVLAQAGLTDIVVVVGAAADEVRAVLLEEDVRIVHAEDWPDGMGASLRAGLRHLAGTSGVHAVLVCLVDTPGLTAAAVRRVAALAAPDVLARATYDGVPGHPVLLGADHLAAAGETAHGDVGARGYLAAHPPVPVECGDLAGGADVDTAADLPPGHRFG